MTVSALLILGAFAKSTCKGKGCYISISWKTLKLKFYQQYSSKESSEESSEDEDEGYVDWTCEQCKDGAIGIGNYYVQRQVRLCSLVHCVYNLSPGPRSRSRPSICSRRLTCVRLTRTQR